MKLWIVVYVFGADDPQVDVFTDRKKANDHRDAIFADDGDNSDVTIHEREVEV